MPIQDYGVWKAYPVRYIVEHHEDDPRSPHLSLYYDDSGQHRKEGSQRNLGRTGKEIPGLFRAAINIKSGDKDSRLVYWVDRDFSQHPIIDRLSVLELGFHLLEDTKPSPDGPRIDFIRSNLFNVNSGRVLPHDIEGPDNDIIDVLEPEVRQAIEHQAEVYIFGARFNTKNGIHDVHMNQGNKGRWKGDDGIFQDGALLIHFTNPDRWVGIFLGFASQAAHTDDRTGHAISSETWSDYLIDQRGQPDLIENSVAIKQANIKAPGRGGSKERRESVTLTNLTSKPLSLGTWQIHNSAGQIQVLPPNAALDAMATKVFDIPHCHLSTNGDTITLVNEYGLKVDGVSYSAGQAKPDGQPIVFAH
ncbi:uncharacterized protein NFIA_040880 [Aspergillus fischeri NRRL 181]|uniref:LTD domain-containing protein n=1 Tax=Neosartorya fischeri (strain ATCC 1020 / DSM 3700 / CBS 544.65 / FGSC A1164 / JCM 1740 / NRRL 181 / WB 181) TaxID=331117 RepID=A1D0J1_NEOFI|nr:conserved hypothetical protein [Aspergillus fischeri NRRL 181]EAW24511.1 conserved hypothetical protein [Aspergillus fischeri NRRL 181]KAG2026240.1 hypothetical protein GB937_001748 [Aspergillus fischeri]